MTLCEVLVKVMVKINMILITYTVTNIRSRLR